MPLSQLFRGANAGGEPDRPTCLRWRPQRLLFWSTLVISALCPGVFAQERDGVRLVPLYRLERRDRSDSLYTVGRSEVDALTKDRNWINRGLVGYGAALDQNAPNLVELRRYREEIRRGRSVMAWHYFANFLKRPNPGFKLQPLGIKVWRRRAPGTVPVYASSDLNDRCIYFAFGGQALKQYDQDYEQATGRRRKRLGLVFYMLPPNYNRSISIPPDFIELDWDLLRGEKYRYGPAVVEHEGRRYLFYGGNIDRPDRPRLCDHVLLRVGEISDGTWRFGDEKVVVSPGEDWSQGLTPYDRARAGVPAVIRGEFAWTRPGLDRQETFAWAMFYSAWDKPPHQGGRLQVGLALAHELTGPWHKTGIVLSDQGGGIGRMAAINRDGRGRVLLLYSPVRGGSMVRDVDLAEVNDPVVVSESRMASAGLTTGFDTPDALPGVDSIALDPDSGRLWLVRAQVPLATNTPEIGLSLQLASIPLDQLTAPDGAWTVHADFSAVEYGVLRLFSPGLARTPEGHVVDAQILDLYVSTASREGTPQQLADLMMSYRIHTLRIDRSKVEGEDAGPGAVGDVGGDGEPQATP